MGTVEGVTIARRCVLRAPLRFPYGNTRSTTRTRADLRQERDCGRQVTRRAELGRETETEKCDGPQDLA